MFSITIKIYFSIRPKLIVVTKPGSKQYDAKAVFCSESLHIYVLQTPNSSALGDRTLQKVFVISICKIGYLSS